MSDCEDRSACHIIKLRGLPWNVCAQDILDFLKDVDISRGENGVHLVTSPRDGRPNGEAFVECASENDYNTAFDYHKKSMGHRYIEIFGAKLSEFDYIMKKQNVVQHDTFVKLRGLPYTVIRDDIEKFFEGLELRSDKDSIQIIMDNRGRATGEAYVQFVSPADTEKALKKNREKIGHRYIEIFRSTAFEVRRSNYYSRPGPYNRNDRGSGNRRNGDNIKDGNTWPLDDGPRPYGRDNFNNFGNGGNGNNFGGGFGGNNGGFVNDNFGNSGFNNFGGNGNGNGNGFNNGGNGNNGGGFNANNGFGMNFGNNSGNNFNRNDNFGGSNFNNGGNFNRNQNCDRYSSDNNGGVSMGWNNSSDIEEFCVHLRGMPYDCDEHDIEKFFSPVKVLNCNVIFNNRGRHSGEADAFFANAADANEAMLRHKEKMGNRYIELFLNSKESRRSSNNKRF